MTRHTGPIKPIIKLIRDFVATNIVTKFDQDLWILECKQGKIDHFFAKSRARNSGPTTPISLNIELIQYINFTEILYNYDLDS